MDSSPPVPGSETRPLPASIRSIYLDGLVDVVIRQGNEPSLTVQCPDKEFLSKVLTSVSGNRLTINTEPMMIIQWNGHTQVFYGPVGCVSSGVSINCGGQICIGNGNIQIGINHGVVTKSCGPIAEVTVVLPNISDLRIQGSGNITYNDFDQEEIDVDISGSGEITLAGKVDRLEADISGSGDITAYDLVAKVAKLRVSGSGGIRATATDSVRARSSGSGKIRIAGNPLQRDTNVSGSGKIKFVGKAKP